VRKSLDVTYPVSLNWAVLHPLMGHNGGADHRYLEWAIPEGPFLAAFRDFGEASVLYPITGRAARQLGDVVQLCAAISELLDTPTGSIV
jgi:hypothetical protein